MFYENVELRCQIIFGESVTLSSDAGILLNFLWLQFQFRIVPTLLFLSENFETVWGVK